MNSLVEYVDDGKPLFIFMIPMKTILETLSMLEKALMMILNIFGNVNAATRLA